MRYCRFMHEGAACYGRVEEDSITDLMVGFPESRSTQRATKFSAVALAEAELLAPVEPSKIICVGRNYKDHASELGHEVPKEPLLFFKPPSSLIAHGADIVLPPRTLSERVDYEGELGVVIGTACRNLEPNEDVRGYIRGYTIVNDVTARDLQKKDGQWARAKGFDTFCPVGPVVSDEVDPWAGLELVTRLNGAEKQRGNTRQFIFDLKAIIHYITQFLTLEPGDLISTGTPAGVAPMQSGDVVEVEVAGLGVLRNGVS